MNFCDEWKSLWPIESVFAAPLLLSGGGDPSSKVSDALGPLIFNPSPQTLTPLFHSRSLSPPFPPLPHHLSLSRFLHSSGDPSTSSSVASHLGPQPSDDAAQSSLRHNRLQLLRCGTTNAVLAFFPTGQNHNQVGFLLLNVRDGELKARGGGGGDDATDDVFRATTHKLNHHRILRLSANPAEVGFFSSATRYTTVGYLLATTMYSVHWFRARIWGLGSDSERLLVENSASRTFKSYVVHACWSPHLPEESVVLLESGSLILFDLESCFGDSITSEEGFFEGEVLRVPWGDLATGFKTGKWLCCEFSWHPRILIVARSDAVFLVDLRLDKCKVSCLLKIETLAYDCDSVQGHKFVALSRAGRDGFYFTVASDKWLVLCDVRRQLMPVLRWEHKLDNPCFLNVFPLSELRSHSKTEKYHWASESGYGTIVGSFWNSKFGLFCYGPSIRGTVASEISKFSKSFYAWELPSDLSFSGRECPCGSCILREEFAKDALPKWIDWRQKKEIVLGFGILNNDLSALLGVPGNFGGFTLIRLLSSGKLESQRYSASWEFDNMHKEFHEEGLSSLDLENSLLYAVDEEDYHYPKKYKYLKLDYLHGYRTGSLVTMLDRELKGAQKGMGCEEKDSLGMQFHQHVCQKLKACGFGEDFDFRTMWTDLPLDLLKLALFTYPEYIEVLLDKEKASLDLLGIPHQPQLPPFFFREPTGKCSENRQSGDDLPIPLLPLPIVPILHNLREDDASKSHFHPANVVSLAADEEQMCYCSQREQFLSLHKPVADESSETLVFRTPEKGRAPDSGMNGIVVELFNSMGLLEPKFHDGVGPKELEAYELLKRQHLNYLKGF